ncbi:steroid hormone receptor ERR1-like isoform X2 [Varroa jacobsoni]|uniref:steroid hormone receptor ERR1-like isoform X2 n=1 Tax=Varroa jacobsoni TaxID=62625 RepID=UPI000BFA96F9|nr:steroid hormone receptor ERR1-like isoform X2 [Varroa jacobsoni]
MLHHMIKREDSNSSIGSSSTPPPMLSAYSEAATALYNNVVKRSISPNQEEHMSFISEFTYSDDIGEEASPSPPLSPEMAVGDVNGGMGGMVGVGSLGVGHYLAVRAGSGTTGGQANATGQRGEQGSPRRVCLVCGDVASGFHYGVASCEACKAFFKRTIQGNIEYTCPANNDCEINKRRRKACQACRFQKCLKMGMLKEGVRLDRVRGGRQKYRRNPEGPYQVAAQPVKRISIDENTIISALLSCEPEPLSIRLSAVNNNASLHDPSAALAALSDIMDRELVNTIGWARQIPGFSALNLDDQMRLLQTSWAEVLSLSLAYRSTNSLDALNYAVDLSISMIQAEEMGLEDVFLHTKHLAQRLEAIRVQKEEFLALKAMALVNAGAVGLRNLRCRKTWVDLRFCKRRPLLINTYLHIYAQHKCNKTNIRVAQCSLYFLS